MFQKTTGLLRSQVPERSFTRLSLVRPPVRVALRRWGTILRAMRAHDLLSVSRRLDVRGFSFPTSLARCPPDTSSRCLSAIGTLAIHALDTGSTGLRLGLAQVTECGQLP